MKKKASELKKGDVVVILGKKMVIEEIEHSDIGKQGVKKCRLVIKNENGEKSTLIRPSDYPFEIV